MDPERWQKAEKVFFAAAALEPKDRPAYLETACAGDPSLAREVASLLQSNEKTGGFLETPSLRIDASAFEKNAESDEDLWTGQTVGAWKLLEKIGLGGMGVVYRASRADGSFEKTVAIKIVKKGMDTVEILRRFRNERLVLAQLQHPYISKLLDAGTTADGRPFLVMEYHEGKPIAAYCDEKRLSIPQRIRLFREVCKAIAHAHQNLVIHRDLKPENILVNRDGAPMLLDFGIAKLLQGDLQGATQEFTKPSERFLTPEYASPEQILGNPVTTVSDVYSLGVLLYELLAGERPFRFEGKGATEIAALLQSQEPVRPSTAAHRANAEIVWKRQLSPAAAKKLLSDELDDILLMALRREPERRYASVREFSDDLGRFFAGQPVRARPDTLGYRTRKFVQRNRLGVSIAGILFVALVGGSAGIAWQAHLKSQALAQAEIRARHLQSFATTLIDEVLGKIRFVPGTTAAQSALVRNSLEVLDTLYREGIRDVSLQQELAHAYLQVGSLQWTPMYSHLGDLTGAEETYSKALSLLDGLSDERNEDLETLRDRLAAHYLLGETLLAQGKPAPALSQLSACLERAAKIPEESRSDFTSGIDTAWVHLRKGNALHRLEKKGEALESTMESARLYERQILANPQSVFLASRLSSVLAVAGEMHQELGRKSQSEAFYRRALLALPQDEERGRQGFQGKEDEWLGVVSARARILTELGDREGASREFRRGIERMEALSYGTSNHLLKRKALASMQEEFANSLLHSRQPALALDPLLLAKEIRRGIVAADPADLGARRDDVSLDQRLGLLYIELDRRDEAVESLNRYLVGMDAMLRADARNEGLRQVLVQHRALYVRKLRQWASDSGLSATKRQEFRDLAQSVEEGGEPR